MPNKLPLLATEFIKQCNMPCIFSTSVKLAPDKISDQRWLITLPDTDSEATNASRGEVLATRFIFDNQTPHSAAPGDDRSVSPDIRKYLLQLKKSPVRPSCIHVGYDREGEKQIRKLYYEYDSESSSIKFSAIKTNGTITELHHYVADRPEIILKKIPLPPSLRLILNEIIDILGHSVSALDVFSENSLRHSLDLNLMSAKFDTKLKDALARLILKIQPSAAYSLSAQYTRPSHLAVGLTAEEIPFLTLYGASYWATPEMKLELLA